MENYSTFTSKESFHSELGEIVDSTSDIFSKIKRSLNSDLCLTNKDSYHFVMDFVKPKTRIEHVLWSLIHRDIHQAEIISGNSAKITFMFAMEFLKELIKHQDSLPKNEVELFAMYDEVIMNLKNHLSTKTQVASMEQVQQMISYICDGNKDLEFAIAKAIETAGLEGKIFVESSIRQSNYIIESKSGYNFALNPFSFMLEGSINKTWDRKDVKVLIIDGLVEKISEIDQILNKAFENKQPLVIIAHGFSEEVVATCKTNNDKGNFDVMPIRMHHDLSSINIIRDIGVVCGTTPITHLLGQLLSTVKWEDLSSIDRIIVTPQNTTIEFAKSQIAVLEHTKDLIAKRYSQDVIEDIRNLLDERLKSLVSHSVILNLPQMSTIQSDEHKVKIDLCLRNCKTILNYGTVNIGELVEDYHYKGCILETITMQALKNTVKACDSQESIKVLPSLSVILGIMLSGKTCLRLIESGGLIELVSSL